MKNLLKYSSMFIVTTFTIISFAAPVQAANVFNGCVADPVTEVCKAANTGSANSIFKIIINTILYAIGAISVIMIVVGGIRYIVSGGDQAGVTSAKNTILYAVVGLIVAIASFSMVNFVIGWF